MNEEGFYIESFCYKGYEVVVLKDSKGHYVAQIASIREDTAWFPCSRLIGFESLGALKSKIISEINNQKG